MTVAEQQERFEQVRNRIQNNLNEIAGLAQNSTDPAVFFPRFLELAVDSLSAQGGVIWSVHGQGSFERLSEVNFASCEFDNFPAHRQSIQDTLTQVAQARRQYIIAAGGPGPNESTNPTAYPYFYTPVVLGDQLVLILQIWLKEAGDPKTYQDIATFLINLASQAVIFLRNRQGVVAASRNEELSLLLRMQASLLGELNPKEVASILVNYTSDLVRADLACLFKRKGTKWRLIAASNQEVIDEKSNQSQNLVKWAEQLPKEENAQIASLDALEEGPLAEAWSQISYEQAAWKVLKAPGHHADHLLCAFLHGEKPFPAPVPGVLDRVGGASGKVLDSAYHYHHLPMRPVLGAVSRTKANWSANRRKRLLIICAIMAAVAGVLFAWPVPLKVTAECSVESRVKLAAVAETPGKVLAVYVKEGQRVEKGQVLAKLEDQDYVSQIAVEEQQRLRWEVETARAQAAGNEADRKVAEINAQREIETVKRLEYLRSKTEIQAPVAGVILTKNLRNREGEAMEKGTVFCEIAGDDYDLILNIKQTDIGDLVEALKAQGALPLDFILQSRSQTSLHATIDSMNEISQLPEIKKDHSAYLVRLPLPNDASLDAVLKPGYTGKAKIRVGRSSLFYSWFRPFLNYWRVEWGV